MSKAELLERMIERDIAAATSDLRREVDRRRVAAAIRSHYANEFKYRGFQRRAEAGHDVDRAGAGRVSAAGAI